MMQAKRFAFVAMKFGAVSFTRKKEKTAIEMEPSFLKITPIKSGMM